MSFTFKKASREQARLRLALIGVSGSGKTYTGLQVAQHLGARVAVIDTERGSASKYAGLVDFDVLELETFSPKTYIEAIQAADAAGYDVLVIDSLSHAWMGKEGALELVDRAAKRQQGGGNSFGAWREVTPLHNALVDAILGCGAHVIVTMRAKTEYVQEKDERTGRTVVRKVGLGPVQRDGLEYEFDVVGDMDAENTLIVTKTRCPELAGAVMPKPGKDLADRLRAWLGQGAAPTPVVIPPTTLVPPPTEVVGAPTQVVPPPVEVAGPSPNGVAVPPRKPMTDQQFLDKCADELNIKLADLQKLFPMTVNEFMKAHNERLEDVFARLKRRDGGAGELLPHEQPAPAPSEADALAAAGRGSETEAAAAEA